MAKQIRKSDISEADLFGDIKKSAERSIGVLKKLDQSLKNTAESIKKIVQSTKGANLNEINKLNKAFKQSNEVKQQSVKINTEIINQQKIAKQAAIEEEKLKQQKIKTQQAELRQAKQLEQQRRKNIKQLNDERNAYQKLVIKTRDQKNESKRLGARLLELEQAGKKNSRAYRTLASEYQRVTRAAQKGDKQLKKLDRTVGDNFRNVGNYRSALGKLQGALGALGVAFGSAMIVRNVAGTMADFDQSVADLSAIMGKTKEEIKGLTEQAKELGATTRFTASEIVGLQISLAKLGFEPEEIQASTQAVSNFAAATGAELADAATLAGSALRGFRLEASEMDRVASVLAVSTTKSALDFEKLQTALSKVSPVAAAFGFSIEDTTALLGSLANAGFDASTMGTATRKILLNLADANGELAQELGRPIKSADDLTAALKELDERGIDLARSLELTDVRSVTAFQTFLKGTDTIMELKEGITDANEELQDMADKRLDSVNGQLALLNSAWEGYIINLTESTGTTSSLKDIIGFLAQNLEIILDTLGKVIMAFVKYRVALLGLKAIQWAFNGGLKTMGKNLVLGAKAMYGMATGTRSAAVGMRALGKAMSGVPLLLMISLVYDLATAFMDATDEASKLKDVQEALDTARKNSAVFSSEIIQQEKKAFEERKRLLDEELRIRIAQGEKQEDIDKERIEREKELVLDSETNIGLRRMLLQAEVEQYERATKEFRKLDSMRAEDRAKYTNVLKTSTEDAIDLDQIAKSSITELRELGIDSDLEAADRAEAVAEAKKEAIKTLEKEEKEYQKLLSESLTQEIELNSERGKEVDKKALAERKKRLKEEEDRIKALWKAYGKLIDLQDAYYLRTQTTEDQEIIKVLQNLDKEIGVIEDDRIASVEEKLELEAKLNEEAQKKIQAIREKFAKKRSEEQFKKDEKALEDSWNKRTMIIAENEANSVITTEEANEQKLLSEMVYLQNLIDLYEKYGLDSTELKTQLYEVDLALQQQYIDETLNKEENLLNAQKDIAQTKIEIAKSITQIITEQSNKRIEQIDKEIQASQKQQDTLRALAEQGNIDAQESLAEQRQIEIELQKQREAELRRQAQLQLAASAYETYQNNVATGKDSKQALAETIRDITVLTQFVKSLPAFEKGTEDTGTHGQGVDGKGGFKAILHPNERVMTKEQNKMVGNLSNMELAQIAQDYNTGKLLEKGEGASQIGGAWSSVAIVKKLDELQKTIQNKPEIDYKVEEILDGVMKLRKSEKRGNTIVHNKYRIK
jgi:TP901 family phage tail tape measure protein